MNNKLLLAMSLASTLVFGNDLSAPIVDLNIHPIDYSILKSTAFNNAPEIGLYLASLAKKFDIKTAVETGTCHGCTTIFLSDYFANVMTIELSNVFFLPAQYRLQHYPNIKCLHGSSEKILHEILPSLTYQPVLFYLDAHWYDQWPLLDELEEIGLTHRDNCIVVIDDFKVPGRQDIPYDAYGENECSFDYIKQKLDDVFTEYTFFYLIPKNPYSRAKFVAYPKAWE